MPEHIKEHPITDADLKKVEDRARQVLAGMPQIYRFHTLPHTEAVVAAVKDLSQYEDITDHEKRIVIAAAWFHDLGYLKSLAEHENLSAFSSLIYLMRLGVQSEDIDQIEQCILATKLGREPRSILEKIIADADMWHLTTPEFLQWADKLRKEWNVMKGMRFTDKEWLENNIRFMNTVKFHTRHGKEVLAPRMEANIRLIEEMLAKGETGI
jgi:predicted metal-dependent HD superfamily phosphohydrolase